MSDPAAAWRQAVRSVVDRQLAGQRENIVGLEASMARLRAIREEVADAELRTALAALEREGWVLAPKEATGEMVDMASDTPEGKMVDGLIVLAHVHGQRHPPMPKDDTLLHRWYRAMLAARPAIVPARGV